MNEAVRNSVCCFLSYLYGRYVEGWAANPFSAANV